MEAEQHAAESPTNQRRNKKKSKYGQKSMKMKTKQPQTYGTL